MQESVAASDATSHSDETPAVPTWEHVRAEFDLDPSYIHLSCMLLASHPRPVREAIEQYRRELDANPVHYLQKNVERLDKDVFRAAADYLGVEEPKDFSNIALTDSTTMGLGLIYFGLKLKRGQEIVTTDHDHPSTYQALDFQHDRTGARVVKAQLYSPGERVSSDGLVSRLMHTITDHTRVVALTWVHSGTGMKLPIQQMAQALAEHNKSRAPEDRVLLCVDGVHGFGVEDVAVTDLGCDGFIAGCHKWLHGPRGTGLIWATSQFWTDDFQAIPSFTQNGQPGPDFSPGGFHSFDHRWALNRAFAFHKRIGTARIAERIHALNQQCKEGLASLPHVTVWTPMDPELSSGIVCFSVDGLSPAEVVSRLDSQNIIATVTPYATTFARLSPGIMNTHGEIDTAIKAIAEMQ